MDPQSEQRIRQWEARLRAASAAWDYPLPETVPGVIVWRDADEPMVNAAVAAYLADWFAQ
jgi:hypothetical protein